MDPKELEYGKFKVVILNCKTGVNATRIIFKLFKQFQNKPQSHKELDYVFNKDLNHNVLYIAPKALMGQYSDYFVNDKFTQLSLSQINETNLDVIKKEIIKNKICHLFLEDIPVNLVSDDLAFVKNARSLMKLTAWVNALIEELPYFKNMWIKSPSTISPNAVKRTSNQNLILQIDENGISVV